MNQAALCADRLLIYPGCYGPLLRLVVGEPEDDDSHFCRLHAGAFLSGFVITEALSIDPATGVGAPIPIHNASRPEIPGAFRIRPRRSEEEEIKRAGRKARQ
jgi:hypothetical protein